jgi:hypothetical protein
VRHRPRTTGQPRPVVLAGAQRAGTALRPGPLQASLRHPDLWRPTDGERLSPAVPRLVDFPHLNPHDAHSASKDSGALPRQPRHADDLPLLAPRMR